MSIYTNQRVPVPTLRRLDPGEPKLIRLQFIPLTGVGHNVGATWSEESSLGRAQPITQFTKGNADTWQLDTLLFARHKKESITALKNALLDAVALDPELGRPPLYEFTWGELSDIVVITDVGGARYTSMRPDGTLRSAQFTLSLRRYEKFDLELTDPNARQHDTFYRVVKQGDTWESLAKLRYGDALLGDLLRRRNPGAPFLKVGTTVKLLDPERFRDVLVTPASYPMARTREGIDARRDLFARRNVAKYSTVVKR
jgi:phage protein U